MPVAAPDKTGWLSRVKWLVVIYGASVLAVGAAAFLLRAILKP